MRLSCTNLMLEARSLTEQAFFLKEIGFDAISVFEEIDGWNDRKFGELQDLQKKPGLKCVNFVFRGKHTAV